MALVIYKFNIGDLPGEAELPIYYPTHFEWADGIKAFFVWGVHNAELGDAHPLRRVRIVGTGHEFSGWMPAQTIRVGNFVWHLLVETHDPTEFLDV